MPNRTWTYRSGATGVTRGTWARQAVKFLLKTPKTKRGAHLRKRVRHRGNVSHANPRKYPHTRLNPTCLNLSL